MAKEETYLVTLTRPTHASVTEVKNYIRDALGSWGGSFRPPGAYGEGDPGDPLFGGVECKVKRIKHGNNRMEA